MYLINTSFHVDHPHFDTLVEFINGRIIPALATFPHIQDCLMLEILIEVDPTVRSLSLQFRTPDLQAASDTLDTVVAPLIDEITTRCGGQQHLMSFTTPMRIIP